ncbi:MAG: dockerin type I repeat-containing protein [Clostridia bacterium]|nr:dockerin type I repeat-containing protein [Clostridia bacterium]
MKNRFSFSKAVSVLLAGCMVLVTCLTGVVAFAENADPLVITDCDTTAGWVNTGGNAVTVNTNGYGTTSAIHRQVNYGAYRALTYNLPEAMDISNYTAIEWDAMFYSQTKNGAAGSMWEQIVANYVENGNNLYLKLTSANGAYRVYRYSKLNPVVSTTNSNWVHFTATIDDYNSEIGGAFDATQLTAFYFSTVDGAINTTVDNGFIRLDNIVATGFTAPAKEPVVISDCEGETNWTYAGNGGVNVSSSGFTGNAILMNTGYGALRKLTYTPSAALNLSDYSAIEWDMAALKTGVITDQFAIIADAYTDLIGFEVTDGTTTDKFALTDWQITETNAVWWHMAVSLADAKCDLSAVTGISIYVSTAGVDSTVDNTIYKLDNMVATDLEVVPNGIEYARISDTVLVDNNGGNTAGWTLNGNASSGNLSYNANGYKGGAVQAYAPNSRIAWPLAYTFDSAVNLSRYNYFGFKIRALKAGAADDTFANLVSYGDAFTVTLADANGEKYAYPLSAMSVVPTETAGWYAVSLELNRANTLDLSKIVSVTFFVSGTGNTELANSNLRVDDLSALVSDPAIAGDANGDGTVDVRDLIRLKRYNGGEAVTMAVAAMDMDEDNAINAADVVALQHYILTGEIDVVPFLSNLGWSETVKP